MDNLIRSNNPTLATREIQDIYVRQNFLNLQDYFNRENQFYGFTFFEVSFDKATANYKLAHNLPIAPRDIVLTHISGSGVCTFNVGKFDAKNMDITVTGPLLIRFYAGSYWNQMQSKSLATNAQMSFSPSVLTEADIPTNTGGTYSVFTQTSDGLVPKSQANPSGYLRGDGTWVSISPGMANPMTTAGDMIYGDALGTPARLANGTAGQYLQSNGGGLAPTWVTPAAPGMANPMTTGGDIIYGGASGVPTRLPNGGSGQLLQSNGGTAAPSWVTPASPGSGVFVVPITIEFTASTTYNIHRAFFVTSASATVGATYTNNGITFTVYATIASGTTLILSGNGTPTSSGTLTKASGTGDATITFSSYRDPLYFRAQGVGGGGGGSGSSAFAPNGVSGGGGGTTSFGTSLLSAPGGGGGQSAAGSGAGGLGGTGATIASPAYGFTFVGGSGQGWTGGAGSQRVPGGTGGNSIFGGGGGGGVPSSTGTAPGPGLPAAPNTGGGGSGAGSSLSNAGGTGGGAGSAFDAIVPNPATIANAFTVNIANAGTAGGGGTAGTSGGAGANGRVNLWVHFQ